MTKNAYFGPILAVLGPKILIFMGVSKSFGTHIMGQKSFFCKVIAILVNGANDNYTRGYNFPIGATPKKIFVSELGVIFLGLTPVFGRFWPFPR